MFKVSKYIVKSVIPSNGKDSDDSKVIIFSTRTGGTIVFNEKVINLIDNKEWEKLSNTELQKLVENRIIVCEDEDEIESILSFNHADNQRINTLSMTIQLTSNCQLGCFYCGQIHSPNKASKKIIEESINRIKDKIILGNYKGLHITWYGGEPLLVIDEIVEYSAKIISFCANNGVEYTADIITNGLLLKEANFKKLVNANITQFQVTLDGNRDTHDQRRVTKKGIGSYDIIKTNIVTIVKSELYKKSNSLLNLRINVDKTMVEGIESLIDEIYQEDIMNSINITFAPVFDWGGNQADKNSFTHQDFANLEIEWMLKLIQLGKYDISLIPSVRSSSCMVDNPDSEVHDAFGNIYACYEYTYTPAYSDESFLEGNLINISKERKKSPIRDFKKDIINKVHSNCIECIYYPVCSGECPKQWMNKKIPCPSFKFNMEDRLLLEYLVKNIE